MKVSQLHIFAESMAHDCDVRIKDKSEIGMWLKLIKGFITRKFDRYMSDFKSWMRPCCLKLGRRFYVVLPFDVGCESIPWMQQVLTIVHECQHAYDLRTFVRNTKKRVANWVKFYIFDDTFRAHAEGMPNTAEGEVYYWLTGTYPTPVCNFDAYWIRDKDAKTLFRRGCAFRREVVMKQGSHWTPMSPAAWRAIDILRGMGIKQGQFR